MVVFFVFAFRVCLTVGEIVGLLSEGWTRWADAVDTTAPSDAHDTPGVNTRSAGIPATCESLQIALEEDHPDQRRRRDGRHLDAPALLEGFRKQLDQNHEDHGPGSEAQAPR